MTKEETMERIKLMQDQLKAMQAYVDGKDIELWNPTSKRWELEENPAWSLLWKYRIKPKLLYRPFKNTHECLEEMKKHEPFCWIKTKVNKSWLHIDSIEISYPPIYIKGYGESYKNIYDGFTFFDGTPFGVKVEDGEE